MYPFVFSTVKDMSTTVEFGDGITSERVTINTTIASKKEQVGQAIIAMMSNSSNRTKVIGLDMIPIRAAPGSSTSTKTSSAIFQLCDSTTCLIVRLHSSHAVPESLYNFLIQPKFTFAGFGIKDTKVELKRDYGLVCKNVFEVGPAMWIPSEHNSSALLNIVNGMRLPLTSTISEPWGSTLKLTEDEIAVAVSNALAAFRIARSMFPNY